MAATDPPAFLSVGLRPFYLGAAVFAAVAVPLWVGVRLGWHTRAPLGSALQWHVHEMLFGFAPAVMAGFLLTAVRTWTGRPTPSGTPLALLFALWALGRIAPYTAADAVWTAIDLTFLPALMIALWVPLWRARNTRNYKIVAVLFLLWVCDLSFHAGTLTSAAVSRAASMAALDLILLLMVIIGGRVIPAFSANAIAGMQPRTWPTLEKLAITAIVLIALLDALSPLLSPAVQAPFPLLLWSAALLHGLRLAGWKPWRTRANLLLLVLPLSYLWIPMHLALRAASGAPPGVMDPAAIHALAAGAMAGLMMSMMTRSALGHTGRPLRAGWPEGVCFGAVHLAAAVRVAAVWLPGHLYAGVLTASATLWVLAFATFAIAYTPRLLQPRLPPS